MPETTEGGPYVSAESAAAALGTTKLKILMLIKEGTLSGSSQEGSWFVTRASLERYRPEHSVTQQAHPCRSGCKGCGDH